MLHFSNLPIIIRKTIVDAVISVDQRYCLVNKEWFNYSVVQFSELIFSSVCPSQLSRSPLFVQYNKAVSFQRTHDLDWDYIYEFKNIKKVDIPGDRSPDNEDFFNKLLRLPPIEELWVDAGNGFDGENIARLIRANRNSLKDLSTKIFSTDFYSLIQNINFPNLISLLLVSTFELFDFKNILTFMPKLKKLDLEVTGDDSCALPPDGTELPNIVELRIRHSYSGNMIFIDISKFPYLRKLAIHGETECINRKPSYSVEELDVELPYVNISNLIYKNFPNLKKLKLSIPWHSYFQVFFTILRDCHTLKAVDLDVYYQVRFPETFPTGLFSAVDLKLSSECPLSSPLLEWLSKCFKLQSLGLFIRTDEKFEDLVKAPFSHLTHIVIGGRAIENNEEWFKNHFNQKNCPQLRCQEIETYPEYLGPTRQFYV